MTPDELLAAINETDPKTAQTLLCALNARHQGLIQAFQATQGKEAEEEAPIRLLQAGAFLTLVGDPPPMLIGAHLPERSLFLLTGKPKHLKSFMALDVADCVATGKPLFGEYTINHPGPVIYLAMEDGDYEVATRLGFRGIKKDDERPLYICTDNFRLATTAAIDKLREIIEPIQPSLVIIDTAAEALGIKKWEDRGEITTKMKPLRDLARQVCSVLLVAHNRKAEGDNGDEIAGSNAFTGAVDGWWSVYEKRLQANGNVQLFYRREGRGGVRGEGAVEMDHHNLKMKALSTDELVESQKAVRKQKEDAVRFKRYRDVWDVVKRLGEATQGDVMRELEIDAMACSRLFKEMIDAQYLEEAGERKPAGGGKPAKTYRATGELVTNNQESIDSDMLVTNSPPGPLDVNTAFFDPPTMPYKENDDEDEDNGWRTAE